MDWNTNKTVAFCILYGIIILLTWFMPILGTTPLKYKIIISVASPLVIGFIVAMKESK